MAEIELYTVSLFQPPPQKPYKLYRCANCRAMFDVKGDVEAHVETCRKDLP